MSYKRKRLISTDGIKYKYEQLEILYGTYFFVADRKVEHQRTLQSYTNVLSDYGGFSSIVFCILSAISIYVNDRLFMGDIVSVLYAAKIQGKEANNSNQTEQGDLENGRNHDRHKHFNGGFN